MPLRMLFSAHGLPEKIVAAAIPISAQVEAHRRRACARRSALPDGSTAWSATRAGSGRWNGSAPSTDAEIAPRRRRAGGRSSSCPIAFVSEHSETLVELDIEYRHLAERSRRAASIARVADGRRRRRLHRRPRRAGARGGRRRGAAPRRRARGCARRNSAAARLRRRRSRDELARRRLSLDQGAAHHQRHRLDGRACSICRGSSSITPTRRAGSAAAETFKVMERRLLRGIMNPAMIATYRLRHRCWLLTPGVVDWATRLDLRQARAGRSASPCCIMPAGALAPGIRRRPQRAAARGSTASSTKCRPC